MPRPPPWPAATLAAPLLLVALQGCSTPMNADSAIPARYPPPGHLPAGPNRLADGPLRFWEHSMGVYCFNTWGCRVQYGDHLVMDRPFEEWQPPAESYPDNLRARMDGDYLGLRNFEGPARLEWRDKAGTPLKHTLDFSAIFADGLLRHRVPREEINQRAEVLWPAIIVEIDDRTVRVHMRAHIPLKAPRIANNPYSDFVSEPVLVYETVL